MFGGGCRASVGNEGMVAVIFLVGWVPAVSGNGRDRRRGRGYERGVEQLRVCIGFAGESLLEGYG